MKVFGICVALLMAPSCSAFAPSIINRVSRTSSALNANALEGWKIDGKIKPTNNFLLIKKAETETSTGSGILLSNSAKVVKTEGVVEEVGPGKLHPDSGLPFPCPVEVGDNVIYGKFDGTEITIDGEQYSLIRDTDILVKFKGDALSEDNVEVVNDDILVRVETRQTETSGGLLLSQSANDQNRPSTGEVVKVGPGRMVASGELNPMSVAAGDKVKFMDFAGNEVKIGDRDFSVVQMPEVLAKF